MNTFEIMKHNATRQFRHNNDNSPSLTSPKEGFVFAYDMEVVNKYVAELEAQLLKEKNENRSLLDPSGLLLPPLEAK